MQPARCTANSHIFVNLVSIGNGQEEATCTASSQARASGLAILSEPSVTLLGPRRLGSPAVGRSENVGAVFWPLVDSLDPHHHRCQQDSPDRLCTSDGWDCPRPCHTLHPHSPIAGQLSAHCHFFQKTVH